MGHRNGLRHDRPVRQTSRPATTRNLDPRPPAHRKQSPLGPQATSRLRAHPHGRAFIPGTPDNPVSMPSFYSFDASAVVHTCSSSRRTRDPLTAGPLPQRSPVRLSTDAACGGLSSPPARRTRRPNLRHWRSTYRFNDLLHRHQTTVRTHSVRSTQHPRAAATCEPLPADGPEHGRVPGPRSFVRPVTPSEHSQQCWRGAGVEPMLIPGKRRRQCAADV